MEAASIDEATIENLIRERNEARKAKNFARADEIRQELTDMNIAIEDRAEGTIWNVINN